MYTAHVDTFAKDRLPPRADWPNLEFDALPELHYPARLNCAAELLDANVARGFRDRAALRFEGRITTYGELLLGANRLAHVLVTDLGLVPGNRVLLRGFNSPMMVALWFAVLKAGGIAVTTMPMLRARELGYVLEKARIDIALCDARLEDELATAVLSATHPPRVRTWEDAGGMSLTGVDGKPGTFDNVATSADDVALIAFTSGTTGPAKGSVHFHRDVLAVTDCFPPHVLRPTVDDIFCGTPPLAFTFGLGTLLLFPFRVGASTVLLEKPSPEALLSAIANEGATIVSTAPTLYRALLEALGAAAGKRLSSLRAAISAGEPLPLATYEGWLRATGIKLIDGFGSTEMLHIVIAASDGEIRPGATGKVIPGYRARIQDDEGNPVPPGTVGKLAVCGPTGCRYLDDPERQRVYVRDGWNLTGDAYKMDEDGYFWFQARADDMIISAGYNISGPEVENVLLEHPRVKECAVVAAPDAERGHVVKAFVVLRDPSEASEGTAVTLQDHVKKTIAPYKYPRAITFVDALPRTLTGKLQRYKLREAP